MNLKKSGSNKPGKHKTSSTSANVDRRTFVKLLPALGAAGLAASNLSLPAAAQTSTPTPSPSPSPTAAPRITKEMMHHAERLIGVELTDAQETMALPNVNRSLDSYETLRKIDVPLDTEPAIAFHPAPARKSLYGPKTKFRFGKVELPQFKSVEDLAFATKYCRLTGLEIGGNNSERDLHVFEAMDR